MGLCFKEWSQAELDVALAKWQTPIEDRFQPMTKEERKNPRRAESVALRNAHTPLTYWFSSLLRSAGPLALFLCKSCFQPRKTSPGFAQLLFKAFWLDFRWHSTLCKSTQLGDLLWRGRLAKDFRVRARSVADGNRRQHLFQLTEESIVGWLFTVWSSQRQAMQSLRKEVSSSTLRLWEWKVAIVITIQFLHWGLTIAIGSLQL